MIKRHTLHISRIKRSCGSGLCLCLILAVMMAACSTKDTANEQADTYICPMHPTVIADQPSTCPVCGMDLVRKARPGEEVKMTEDLTKLIKSPNETVIASIKTIRGEFKSMPITLELNGVVRYDTRTIHTIPARVGGRLEKVLLKYNFQSVSKGQKIAEVYSAELVSAQRELIYLLQKDATNTAMIEAAKNKLILLGATTQQTETLVKDQEIQHTFALYSPYSGYVISETEPTPSAPQNEAAVASSGGMGMGGASVPNASANNISSAPSSSMLRAGNYVSTGQTLFKVVNLNSLWLEFQVPGANSALLNKGDELIILNEANDKLRIDFIEPFSQAGKDFLTLRAYTKGDRWSIGQLVKVKFSSQSKESLWLPQEAITDLGSQKIVFIKERSQFKSKKIEVGMSFNGYTEVRKGISSGDEVAANAQYLIDSESFIKTSN